MAAKTGSFMRLLILRMASSIAGETNFLCDGGGLEHIEVVKSSSSKKKWRGGISAIDAPSSQLLLTICTNFFSRISRTMNRAVSRFEQLRQRMNAGIIILSALQQYLRFGCSNLLFMVRAARAGANLNAENHGLLQQQKNLKE
jgi:hypothetical protein